MRSFRGSQSEPPRHKGSEHMAMREQGHMAIYGADLGNHTIDPSPNLLGAFPTRATVGEHHPARPIGMNLLWG